MLLWNGYGDVLFLERIHNLFLLQVELNFRGRVERMSTVRLNKRMG